MVRYTNWRPPRKAFWVKNFKYFVRVWSIIPKTKKSTSDYQTIDFYNVTPPGFEPRSKEPESSILSIKLWGRNLRCKVNNILLTEAKENHHNEPSLRSAGRRRSNLLNIR